MRDRRLEKNIARVEAFIELWKQLSQFLDRGFRGGPFSDQEEAEFLDLKSRIAQQYELVMTMLGMEAERDEKALRLLNSVPSLAGFRDLPEGMDKRLSNEWHSTYLAMQALLGRLRGRQAQLASINTFAVAWRSVFANPLVLLVVALMAAYGVYRLAEDLIPKIYRAVEEGDKP